MLNRSARLIRRIAVTAAGLAVLGLGVFLLIFPGPGFLVVALGFFILGLEYEWARYRFEQARQKAADLADQAAANVWSTAFTILFGLGMAAAGMALILVETLPFSSPWTGGSIIFGAAAILCTILVSLWQARQARDAGRPTPAELIDLAEEEERRGRTPAQPTHASGPGSSTPPPAPTSSPDS